MEINRIIKLYTNSSIIPNALSQVQLCTVFAAGFEIAAADSWPWIGIGMESKGQGRSGRGGGGMEKEGLKIFTTVNLAVMRFDVSRAKLTRSAE